jgi:hypothetical protein
MQRISWTQRIRNEEVLNRMETFPELINTFKTRKTTYMGHLMRHEEYRMLQIMLQGKTEGKRNVGRKGKSWPQNIKEWTRQIVSTLFHMAQDREQPQLR